MKKKYFDKIAKEKFNFLENEFSFKLFKCKKEDWGYELIYLNKTTGVKIDYEYGHAYLFITLYKLVNEKFQENPLIIKSDSKILGYSLDDIILLKDPECIIKPAYEYGKDSKYYDQEMGLTFYISDHAKNLIFYAKDVLLGDFKIFDNLEKIVKDRAAKYNS
jgi:hypothetical protein